MYMYMSEYVLPEVNLLQKNLKNNTSDGCEYRPIEDNKIKTVCYHTFCRCGPKFFGLSWEGMILYISSLCVNYAIGYNTYKYANLGMSSRWNNQQHSYVRIVGDIVTTCWFGLGIISLPWHKWEEFTCIKDKTRAGYIRYIVWELGMVITMIVYGYLRELPLFQTSLNYKDMTDNQHAVYYITFSMLGVVVMYWFSKLCSGKWSRKCCTPSLSDKVVFIRLFILVAFMFVMSAVSCLSVDGCDYHLHHWWFGYVLVLLTTTSLDNWFDYLLQGVFYAFLIESIFNNQFIFGHYFI